MSRAAPAITRAAMDAPEVRRLIAALDAEIMELYPEDRTADHFRLDADEVAPGRGAFFLAWIDGRAVGCGAVRLLDARSAEVKRMFVEPARRGQGVGTCLLRAIEAEARALGAASLLLETGPRQPAAIALYAREGFVECAPFSEYPASPLSRFMSKVL